VLLLDKPHGMSSNAALQRAKRRLNAAKAGHTGTLDPMATGLLPLTFGEATKFSQMLLDADKVYEAVVRFGSETDTGDAEGQVIATAEVGFPREALDAAMAALRGEIEQIPPMYSALKRDGKPLYEYARAGIEVERAPRRVTIHALNCLTFDGHEATLRVHCSKGTYIRTLAIDLGRALGCGAHLAALRRTAIGTFSIEQAVTPEVLETAEPPDGLLEPVDALIAAYPRLDLDEVSGAALMQGRELPGEGAPGLFRLYCQGRFIGLGERLGDGRIVSRRLIATGRGD
jgi:tRNA pseudouridine55 synthase